METHTPRPPARPFDHRLSSKIDFLIIALDSAPSWNKRAWLRFQKRLLELRVPKGGAR